MENKGQKFNRYGLSLKVFYLLDSEVMTFPQEKSRPPFIKKDGSRMKMIRSLKK